MCLGAAWEAEAPPTHLEALNSLKGPWSAEAREKGLLSASFVGKPPLAPAGPLSDSAGSSCSGGTSGRWVEGRPPFLQSSPSLFPPLASLSLPRPQGSPGLPLPGQEHSSASCSGKQRPWPLDTLQLRAVKHKLRVSFLLRVTLCSHHKRETENLGIPLITATGPKCGQ
jgi:hypothetical protein